MDMLDATIRKPLTFVPTLPLCLSKLTGEDVHLISHLCVLHNIYAQACMSENFSRNMLCGYPYTSIIHCVWVCSEGKEEGREGGR